MNSIKYPKNTKRSCSRFSWNSLWSLPRLVQIVVTKLFWAMQGNPWWCYRSSSETTRHFCCRDLIGWKSRPCGGTLLKREATSFNSLLFQVCALPKSYMKKSDWSKSELRKIDARKFKTISANIRKRQNFAYFVILGLLSRFEKICSIDNGDHRWLARWNPCENLQISSVQRSPKELSQHI